jgi:hypothetical protein
VSDPVPAPPGDLVDRGVGFWRAVCEDHELRPDELELLAEACRLLDLADRLRAETAGGPLLVDGRTHPLLVELRQVREQLRKSLSVLAFPDEVADADSPELADFRSWRARKAARARWDRGA